MIKYVIYILFSFICNIAISQNSQVINDSIKKSKLNFTCEVISRYIWRGQSWGGDYVVVQPTLKYNCTSKFLIGTWATTNFKSDYFYPDGSSYKGYYELDFFIAYKVNKYLTLQVWDYYWPSVSRVEGIDNSYFNYGPNGVKTVDLNLLFDFSEVWRPFTLTISSLLAGNDFRYDSNDENPKQNFTTYAEIGYSFKNIFKKEKSYYNNIDIVTNLGAVLNNQAQYYTAGDYNKLSIVNMSLKAVKTFSLNDKWTLPIYLNYVHNAANENTEVFGRNFLLLGGSINY